MRAKVSLGPPKHAAHDGAAGVVQPDSSKISAAVLPSQPGTGSVYTSAHTCAETGVMLRLNSWFRVEVQSLIEDQQP